jgi:hypothetical protein
VPPSVATAGGFVACHLHDGQVHPAQQG